MANIEEKVEKLLIDKVNVLGYELYDVQYAKEGKDYFLKVFIDRPNGIDLNDCEKVSNEINPLLDEVDYIKEQYFLEVSSPWIERILRKDKHLKDNIGKLVELRLFKPIDKQKSIEGTLENFDNDSIAIKINEDIIKVERKNISVIKTIYEW